MSTLVDSFRGHRLLGAIHSDRFLCLLCLPFALGPTERLLPSYNATVRATALEDWRCGLICWTLHYGLKDEVTL